MVYLKWITNKDLLVAGNSAQCYAAAWIGAGGWTADLRDNGYINMYG